MEISYTTEDPAPAYVKKIRKAESLDDLRKIVSEYKEVAEDAITHVASMTEEDFNQFRLDVKNIKTAKGKVAEDLVDKWGDIVLPRKMLLVSLTAVHFHAPWGTAYIRMEEMGWPE